jgi:hypothetical protein
MTKKYVSAPAKLMKSVKSKPKSEFHIAVANIINIIDNLKYEKDKKTIDNSYKKKFSKNSQLESDAYLLNKIYTKPRRKFRISNISPEKDNKSPKNVAKSSNRENVITITSNGKNNTYKRKVFTIIDVPMGAKTGAMQPNYVIKK